MAEGDEFAQLEVADVFRQHGQEFLNSWGHVLFPPAAEGLTRHRCLPYRCARHSSPTVRPLRPTTDCLPVLPNRHCPKCHSRTRDEWLRDRSRELLPVPYCHVVFTLPHELAPVALQNPRTVYGILFRAVASRSSKWQPIPNGWEPGLVFLRSYTLGRSDSNRTLIS